MDEFNEEVCKLYKNIDEQIEYLKMFKKIIINENERYILEDRNYISVINPYKDFLQLIRLLKILKGIRRKFIFMNRKHLYKIYLMLLNMMIKFLTIFSEPLGNLKGSSKMY